MRPLHKSVIALTAAAALFALSIGQTPPPARALAVVNISKVFSSLNEQIDGTAEIENMANKAKADQQKREQDLEQLANELRDDTMFKKDSPEYRQKQDEALQKRAELEAFSNMSQQKLLIEQRVKTIAIYRRMNAAIAQYAQENGIGLVLVADDVNFDQIQTIEGVQQRISNRKVIYAHPDFDITQKIIEKMNANYKLGNK